MFWYFLCVVLLSFGFLVPYIYNRTKIAKEPEAVYLKYIADNPATVASLLASDRLKYQALLASFFFTIFTLIIVPFAGIQLLRVDGVLPTASSLASFIDLLTGLMLYWQSKDTKKPSTALLGSGFILAGVFLLSQLLVFPHVFGISEHFKISEAASYFYYACHFSLTTFTIIFLFCKDKIDTKPEIWRKNFIRNLPWVLALIISIVEILCLRSSSFVPPIVNATTHRFTVIFFYLEPIVIAGSIVTLFMLLRKFKTWTVLETWVAVETLALALDGVLQIFAGGRYTAGWYLSRLLQDTSALFVLIALLAEVRHIEKRIQQVFNLKLQGQKTREIVEELQKAFLPRSFPTVNGIDFQVTYNPAGDTTKIGGDWYDVFPIDNNKIAIAIGDVAGHGIQAAVTMAEVRQSFRAIATAEKTNPASIVNLVNKLLTLQSNEEHKMVTVIFGILDTKDLTFEYSNAGHPQPFTVPINKIADTKTLHGNGLPLGVISNIQTNNYKVKIENNSMLVLYTDGIIEDNRDVNYGIDKLIDIAKQYIDSENPSADIVENILPNKKALDDVAVLTIKIKIDDDYSTEHTFSSTVKSSEPARKTVRDIANKAGLKPDAVDEIAIAVGEAVNNSIEHATKNKENVNFNLVSKVKDSVLVVEVVDNGIWSPQSTEKNGRGRGIDLMKSFSKNVIIETDNTGTRVKMTFDIK